MGVQTTPLHCSINMPSKGIPKSWTILPFKTTSLILVNCSFTMPKAPLFLRDDSWQQINAWKRKIQMATPCWGSCTSSLCHRFGRLSQGLHKFLLVKIPLCSKGTGNNLARLRKLYWANVATNMKKEWNPWRHTNIQKRKFGYEIQIWNFELHFLHW